MYAKRQLLKTSQVDNADLSTLCASRNAPADDFFYTRKRCILLYDVGGSNEVLMLFPFRPP